MVNKYGKATLYIEKMQKKVFGRNNKRSCTNNLTHAQCVQRAKIAGLKKKQLWDDNTAEWK
jgi:hypothetical protein